MATPRERLDQLRKRKRLADLRARKVASEQAAPAETPAVEPGQELNQIVELAKGFGRDVQGIGEAGLTIATSAIAEPIAGAVGLKDLVLKDAQAGAETVKEFQQGITFKPGESGQEKLLMLGEGIAKLGEIKGIDKIVEGVKTAIDVGREKAGDFAALLANPMEFMATGGKPTSKGATEARGVGESLAIAFPQAALELTSVKGLRALSKMDNVAVDAVKRSATIPNQIKAVREVSGNAKKMLQKSAPSVAELKTGATAIYDQIDNLGVTIKPEALQKFAQDSAEFLRKEGFDAQSDPALNRAVVRLQEAEGAINTTEIGVLRKVAQNATQSSNKSEARMARLLVNRFDNFLTELNPAQASGPDVQGLGQMYKQAGELWRRSIKTETIDDLFSNAADVSDKGDLSFAQSLKNEFSSLVRRNQKTKQFNEKEISEMRRVFNQGTVGGTLSFIGRLDLTQGQKANMIGLSVAGGVGASTGIAGGLAVPLIGFVSRKLADKLTAGRAEFAKAVVAAGNNGNDIVNAYLRNVPKKKRDSIELTELLINSGADLKGIRSKAPIVRESIENAQNFTPDELALAFGLATPSDIQEEGQ